MGTISEMTPDYSVRAGSGPVTIMIPEAHANLRLDQSLARLFPEHSRSQVQQWIAEGCVTVSGWREAEAKRRVGGGEAIVVHLPSGGDPTTHEAQAIPLSVVFEDAAILVLDKPAGLVVHPGAGNPAGTLLNALLAHAPGLGELPRAGIVHRLDKDTTGLMVVAKSATAQTALVRQLQARDVSRHYLAAVCGTIDREGTVDAPIGRHPAQRTRMAVVERGKPAVTHYRPVRRGQGWSWIECRLETGRTHQIRVHMAHVGHPLLGDPVYGPRRVAPAVRSAMEGFGRQALHACRLGLVHPQTGTPMAWESPVPADLGGVLDRLEKCAQAC